MAKATHGTTGTDHVSKAQGVRLNIVTTQRPDGRQALWAHDRALNA